MKWSPVPHASVRLGGELRGRMDRTLEKILHHMDVEEIFARHFRHRSEKPEIPGGFAGYGMFLDAVVKAAVHGIGGEETRRFKRKWLTDLIASQAGDGSISVFAGEPGFWDSHEQAYLIQAFVLDHRYFGSEESLNAALRLGHFLRKRRTPPTLGLETAYLMLFQESGEQAFLEACRRDFRLTESMEVYDRLIRVNGVAHVYTWIARVLAQLQYAQLTGDNSPTLLAGAEELYRRVFRSFSSISGSCSGGIFWGEVWDDSQIGVGKWGETCVSAYLLRCTAKLFEFRADPEFGDLYERILYNAFFGAQSEDGMKQRYFIPFNEPGAWYQQETYCCPNNLRRMMFELPDAVYFTTPDGIAVNLYSDSVLTLPDVRMEQKTSYPESETVQLRIVSKKRFSLMLRIPQWCPCARITANGIESRSPHGWHRCCVGPGETEVTLQLPMPIRLIRGTMAQTGRAALMRGPLVYAVEQERNALSGHDMDLLALDNTAPFSPESGGIRATCVIRNGTHPRRDVLFTRFSSEHRTRTFFPVLSDRGVEEDYLYSSGRSFAWRTNGEEG